MGGTEDDYIKLTTKPVEQNENLNPPSLQRLLAASRVLDVPSVCHRCYKLLGQVLCQIRIKLDISLK